MWRSRNKRSRLRFGNRTSPHLSLRSVRQRLYEPRDTSPDVVPGPQNTSGFRDLDQERDRTNDVSTDISIGYTRRSQDYEILEHGVNPTLLPGRDPYSRRGWDRSPWWIPEGLRNGTRSETDLETRRKKVTSGFSNEKKMGKSFLEKEVLLLISEKFLESEKVFFPLIERPSKTKTETLKNP